MKLQSKIVIKTQLSLDIQLQQCRKQRRIIKQFQSISFKYSQAQQFDNSLKFKYIKKMQIRTLAITLLLILGTRTQFVDTWLTDDFNHQNDIITYRQFVRGQNIRYIQQHNAKTTSQSYSLYPYQMFIHYDQEEIRQLYMSKVDSYELNGEKITVQRPNYKVRPIKEELQNYDVVNIDYRIDGQDGGVGAQGKCGCCYVWAAEAAIYHRSLRVTGRGTHISIQQVVDCMLQIQPSGVKKFGCEGGWPHQVMDFVKVKNTTTDNLYRYTLQTFSKSQEGVCKSTENTINFKISSSKVFTLFTAATLIQILKFNVVAVGITSNNRDFLYYKNGTLTNCGSTTAKIDHAVSLVGAFVDPYKQIRKWVVKNSWGVKWGEGGYVYISMENNTCGIQTYASVPLLIGL